MPYFIYRAIDRKGALLTGMSEGSDLIDARERVSSDGLYVISLKQTPDQLALLKKLLLEKKVRRTDIIEFAKNLSTMLRAGVPIFTAMTDVAKTVENSQFRLVITSMRRMIERGAGFSEAASAHKNVFPGIFIKITAVGEETGRLEQSLQEIADHLQKMEDLAASVKRALIYPAFAVVATFGALIFWLVYVLPKIIGVLTDMGVKIPLPTRILIFASESFRAYWFLLPILAVLVPVAVKFIRRHKRLSYHLDSLKLKLPIVKHIVYNKLLVLFVEQMRILVCAGVQIDKSLKVVSDVLDNAVFVDAIDTIRKEISLGSRISDAMARQKVFAPLVQRMIDIGESSGSLDDQFAFLSSYYLKKLDDVSQKISKTVEPVVIGVVGALFAVIIMGLLLPIYDVISRVG